MNQKALSILTICNRFMRCFLLLNVPLIFISGNTVGQNSVLVNFGSTTCSSPTQPSFALIKNPLSSTPLLLSNCSMTAQLPDFFSVFVAYNPADNNLYIADVRTGVQSRIWKLDIGLPGSIACPPVIPVSPTFAYPYVSNNFEFDNNGDLWSFSNHNISAGRCNIDKFDVATGQVLSSKIIQFPTGNFPTTITSGDLCILPNGRMFATLGSTPSQLYEILNYNAGAGNAIAVYLKTLPRDCYGIAYLNGDLEITGTNIVNQCYYYQYSIASNTLGPERPFQNAQSPIDNTSFTPALGTTKRLLSALKVNANTGDITYEIFVRNMGNVILNDINVTEDLGKVFGAANISNLSVSFVPGSNMAGLTLNPNFNGTTHTQLLNPAQSLPNQRLNNNDYFFKIELRFRVTNLLPNLVYMNSAIGNATINNDVDRIIITDSSNNGPQDVVDPNNDGNASGVGENVPTPFSMNLLPVKFLSVQAALKEKNSAMVSWKIATPTVNADRFDVEFSTNGIHWTKLTTIPVLNAHQGAYNFLHTQAPAGHLYYRIRQTDLDGVFVYSPVVLVLNKSTNAAMVVYPNPANTQVMVALPGDQGQLFTISLYDAIGRPLSSRQGMAGTMSFSTATLPAGIYLLRAESGATIFNRKFYVQH